MCRAARQQTNWSAHAYGLAIDLNPFDNPYQRGDLVLPELASSYLDRSWKRAGNGLSRQRRGQGLRLHRLDLGGQLEAHQGTAMHFSETGR